MNKQEMHTMYKELCKIACDLTAENSSSKSMMLACINLGKLIMWVDLKLEDLEEQGEEDD